MVQPQVLLETKTKITDTKVNLFLLHTTAESTTEKLGCTLDVVGSFLHLGFILDLLEHWMRLVQCDIIRIFTEQKLRHVIFCELQYSGMVQIVRKLAIGHSFKWNQVLYFIVIISDSELSGVQKMTQPLNMHWKK